MRLPQHFLNHVRGRYPGSQVLTCRLPMIAHSGMMANPHSLTVAGAAQALGTSLTCFPFNPAVLQPGTSKRGELYHRRDASRKNHKPLLKLPLTV